MFVFVYSLYHLNNFSFIRFNITRNIQEHFAKVSNTQKNPYLNQTTKKILAKSRNRKFQTQQNPSIIPVT